MDFKNFENNVSVYTGKVKDKFLIINGSTVALNTKVADNEADIAALQSNLYDVSVNLIDISTAVYNKFAEIDSSLVDLQGDVDEVRQYVNTQILQYGESISGRCDSIDSSISDLRTKYNELGDADTLIVNWKDSHTQDFNTLKSDVSTLQQTVNTLDNSFNGHVSSYNLLNIKYITHEQRFNEYVADTDSSISALKTADTQINSSISGIKNDVSALNSSINSWVASHTTNYNALVTADTQINSSISDIKTTIGSVTDASTANTLFGMIKALKEMFDENELVTAQSLVDIDARLTAGSL